MFYLLIFISHTSHVRYILDKSSSFQGISVEGECEKPLISKFKLRRMIRQVKYEVLYQTNENMG